jgi:ribonuclease HI
LKGNDSSSASTSTPKKFYAVQSGRVPGIYTDWPSAQKQIVGWTKPKHKSFTTRAEAEAFIAEGPGSRDVTGIFPPTSPPPIQVWDGAPADSAGAAPAAKKAKPVKTKQAAQVLSGPGLDYLSPDAEDGFDDRILMDPGTGDMRYKTDLETAATKLVPKTDHYGETLHIWTDGACMFNGQAGASVGGVGVYFGPRDPR